MTSTRQSPKKVTLAMIRGKPITTSVPVIHYHASDDELEEIYPSTDEEKRSSPDLDKASSKITFSPSKNTHESDVSDNAACKSAVRSVSTENIVLEGTPPSLDPWKVFSDIKGKITKTFEEKLSEIKNDKRKRHNSRAESSSISDSEDQGCVTPSNEKADDKQLNESTTTTTVHRRGYPARYVGFSGVKTGLKDKSSLQDESVESGVEASEFTHEVENDADSIAKNDSSTTEAVVPLSEHLLGFIVGVFVSVTVYDVRRKLEQILTTLPDEKSDSNPPIPVLEIPAVEEHAVVERFQGWVNELPYSYQPNNYHVARTKSVYLRLEGSVLRIMETRTKVPKKAVWDEPKHKLKFVKRRVYDLTRAEIELLPHGLTRRRRWSKKYPICVTVEKKALTCNVTLKSATTDGSSVSGCRNRTTSRGRVKYRSGREWGQGEDSQDEDEIWLVNTDEEETREEGEERDIDDENELFNYESTNSNMDNEHVRYEECIVESEETEEHMDGEKKRNEKDSKEQQKEDVDPSKDAKKICACIVKKKRRSKENLYENKGLDWEEEGKQIKRREDERDKGELEEMKEDESEVNLEQDELEEEWEEEWEEDEEYCEEEEDEEGEDEEGVVIDDDDNCYYDELDAETKSDEAKEVEKEKVRSSKRGKKRRRVKEMLKNTFKKCNDERMNELKLFIFARTDREKEDWYRRLVSAASRSIKKHDSSFAIDSSLHASNNQSAQQKTANAESKSSFSAGNSHENVPELSYNAYMAKYLENGSPSSDGALSTSVEGTLWVNCLLARILFDLRNCPETISVIQDKIQRKLSSIKLPYFMECLLVSEIVIGQGAPVIRNVTKPMTNERGLWLDLDLVYKGSLAMTVETKLNLMKLTRTGSVAGNANEIVSTDKQELITRSPIFDSDLEDTPETSTEDDCDTSRTQAYNTAKDATPAQSSGKKFLSMVDKIAANKYFQHATELSYVRRAIEGVSNTEIRLMVTVSSIEGRLSINIPPAPSDRLWYGFKPVPKVNLTVKPAVGERTVNIVYVTKWIEAKLLREFEKLVVLPNMDDLIVPLCPNYPYMATR
ncbi:uncharacterized protein LOC108627724 isoform X2 [Ceratina calcarata]|uniref:Uncharacterized protein LOC108627724 isoform X2 n=1 Tax=Ceratina calcarata TaxID=156304 RepID=A0AAJ7S642_9HYME|nr:uncharacterized protein LOC108627724 isoform X2 [Ceratina calcarata]